MAGLVFAVSLKGHLGQHSKAPGLLLTGAGALSSTHAGDTLTLSFPRLRIKHRAVRSFILRLPQAVHCLVQKTMVPCVLCVPTCRQSTHTQLRLLEYMGGKDGFQ